MRRLTPYLFVTLIITICPSANAQDCAINFDIDPVELISFPGFGDGRVQIASTEEVEGEVCVTGPNAIAFQGRIFEGEIIPNAPIGLTLDLIGPIGINDPGVAGGTYQVFWGTDPALIIPAIGNQLCPFGCVFFGQIQYVAFDAASTDVTFVTRVADAALAYFPF